MMPHIADTSSAAVGPDPSGGSGCFSASMPLAGRGVYSPCDLSARDRHMSRGTSSRRPLWSCRRYDSSPVPSPSIRSTEGERYRKHQQHRACHENNRSSRFHSPLRESNSRFTEGERCREHQHLCSRDQTTQSLRFHSPLRGSKSRSTEGGEMYREHQHHHTRDESSRSRIYHSPGRGSKSRSPEGGEMYREHHHHHTRDESSRSHLYHSPCKVSKSVPLPEWHRLEDRLKGHSSLPSYKRYRMEDGCKGSSSGSGLGGKRWYDDGEGSGSRGRYGDVFPSGEHPCRHDHHLGGSKRNSSPCNHGNRSSSLQRYSPSTGKPPLPMPMEISPWDDGYKSPTSPTYYRDNEQYIQYVQRGSLDCHQDETPGWLDSASGSCSGIAGRTNDLYRESNFKCKDDLAYDTLVDDFMDAVSKSWRNPTSTKVDKEAYQKQTNRFAELALKRYNRNKSNKVKYSLVEATVSSAILEGIEIYAHVNFYAKAKNGPKKNDDQVLVFAELHQIGRRLNAMALTSFQLLDQNQIGGRGDEVQNSHITQYQDMGHCYACSYIIKHPDGLCYKAGHFADMRYHHN